jgi:hypothetical protein
MSEWYIILVTTAWGQRVAISQEMDGQVMGTAGSREEAIEQAQTLAQLIGMEIYNSELDEEDTLDQ